MSFALRRGGHGGHGGIDVVGRWLLVTDTLAVAVAWTLQFTLGGADRGGADLRTGTVLVLVAVIATLCGLAAQDLYRSWAHLSGPVGLTRILRSTVITVIVVLLAAGAVDLTLPPARAVLVGVWMAGLLVLGRWVVAIGVHHGRSRGRFAAKTLLVGADDVAYRLWRHVTSRPDSGRVVVGYVGAPPAEVEASWTLPWLGPVGEAVEVADANGADGIVIALSAVTAEELDGVVHQAHGRGLDVELTGGPAHLHHRRLLAADVVHEPVLFVEPRRAGRLPAVVKRLFDVVGAGVLVVVTSPVLVLGAVATLLDDGRPIFYRQCRIGKDLRPFRIWKFRTMERDAEARTPVLRERNERSRGPLFKVADDPRVTGVGRVLRALSIDELPQLFNVLAGSMSLVGPRPALPSEVADFDAELQTRSRVKPGMTGLWQIEARDNPDFYAYRQLDLFYAENWSFVLDVAILVYTVPCLIRHALFERRTRSATAQPAAADRAKRSKDVPDSPIVRSDGSSFASVGPR